MFFYYVRVFNWWFRVYEKISSVLRMADSRMKVMVRVVGLRIIGVVVMWLVKLL